jgi:hypothetical protein
VMMTTLFFWVVMQCRLVGRCQFFGETYCLHLQGWSPSNYLWDYTTSQLRTTHPLLHWCFCLSSWLSTKVTDCIKHTQQSVIM